MKHLIYILTSITLAILATACSDDDFDRELEAKKRGIVVKLSSGNMDTKAHLYSQSNWHHVEKVYAILYYCGSDLNATTDPTNTKVVHSELLKKQGNIWAPNKDNKQQLRDTFHLALPETYAHLLPGKYMVLCVGIDDESGKTYNLGYDDDIETSKPEFARKDVTLDKAIAALKTPATADATPDVYNGDKKADPNANKEDGDLIKYGHPGMAHSEFFAGWTEFTFKPGDLNVVEVDMRRRVAGVLCYLSDIPYKLNIGTKPYRVTKVRLNLNGNQNTQIDLMRKLDKGKPAADDFGTVANASKVLCEFDLTSFGSIGDKKLLFEIPTKHLQGRTQKENTILMGAYMLPMDEIKGAAKDKTLSIELLGKEYSDNEEGNIVPNSNEVSITSFPVLFNKEGVSKHSFPIRPNMIYHIGQKLDDDNLEGDYPESLAGTKVSVKEEPWSKAEINVEFPSVPINPAIRIVCSRGEYKVQPKTGVPNDKYYIFDCMGTDTNYLVVNPSILYENWRVKASTEDMDKMIYFKKIEDDGTEKYVDTYQGSGNKIIPIVITDYAVNDKNIEKRYVNIVITSLEKKDDGTLEEVATSNTSLKVEQYNATIVDVYDNDDMKGEKEGTCGFSHFDFGSVRDLSTGEVKEYGKKIRWGFFETYDGTLYDRSETNGYLNVQSAKEEYATDYFKGCAMEVCSQKSLTINKDGNLIQEIDTWYLPAMYELYCYFMGSYNCDNIISGQRYWSSTTFYRSSWNSWALIKGKKKPWDKSDRDDACYARQATRVLRVN